MARPGNSGQADPDLPLLPLVGQQARHPVQGAAAEAQGWDYEDIGGEITVEGGEYDVGPVETTDESTVSFETTDAGSILDAMPDALSEEATDAIVDAVIDAGDGDMPDVAVRAFVQEVGLSPELSRESMITVKNALQEQANAEIVAMGVEHPGDLYMQLAPALRREIAVNYARGDDTMLRKVVMLYLHGQDD